MLDALTPEQAYELCCYHSMEPFGEVRADIRMARLLQFYYDSKRGKKGKKFRLEDFMLYEIGKRDEDEASEAALLRALHG